MRIRYRPQALGDIDEIGRYAEKRNSAGAANVLRAIYAGIHLTAEQPYAYRRTDDPACDPFAALKHSDPSWQEPTYAH
jgi:plasmid stabilization system protein ParE